MLRRSVILPVLPMLAAVLLLAGPAGAGSQPPIYTGFLSKLAVGGYDPVAYFQSKRPVKGKSRYSLRHRGASWRFSSQANLDKFRANPGAYAPKYGGYCAWAIAQGYTAKGDPMFWRIKDGKLYLNYDAEIQARWEKDIPGFIRKADGNWPKALNAD